MNLTDDALFTANLDDLTAISKSLHELSHAGGYCVLVISKLGIRLVSADERAFQVSAFIPASDFSRFGFDHEKHEQVTFRFILRDFIECLNLLRDDTIVEGDQESRPDLMKSTLYIQWMKVGEPLKLSLENQSNYVIKCDLKAFNSHNDFSPLQFYDDEESACILMDSKKLYEYVSGLDLNSSEFIQLVMGRGDIPLKLTLSSSFGEIELEVPASDAEIIKKEISVSDNCIFSFTYKTQFVRPALEALRKSSLMQMRCASNGILCIELQSPHSVEYFIESEAKPIDIYPD